ncbi:MAG: aspartate kinase, partial [Sarcina sp.]|nr:aspartate kinase [Sarcina sp.]
MKVVKFGGSSLANAEQFKKVASIVLADKTRRYVIPSAPGKRFNGDIKVTDLLYRMASEAQQGEDFSETLAQIKDRYNEIIEGLELKDFSLDEQFAGIEARMKKDP